MENKRDLVLVVALAIAGLAFGIYMQSWLAGGEQAAAPPVAEAPPQTRPHFSLPDTQGVRHDISEWDGKVLVVNFWATWCPPCRKEIPEFIELQNELGPRGLQFVGVAIDQADKVRTFTEQYAINYPSLHGEADADAISTAYGNSEGVLPYSVVSDREGNLVYAHRGALSKKRLIEVVSPLL